MSSPVLIAIGFGLVIMVGLLVFFAATRKIQPINELGTEGKFRQGVGLTIGMSLGIILGLLLGAVANNLPGGIAIGVGIGLLIGAPLEKRLGGQPGPFTEEEKRQRLNRAGIGLVAIVILMLFTLAAAIIPL